MLRYSPLLLLLLAGCGPAEPATYPVEGVAEVNGKPTEAFTVEFSSQAPETKGVSARGVVGADGKFKLTTMVNGKEKPGAVTGLHKVVLVPPPSGMGPAVVNWVNAKFGDYNSTPLAFEVKPGEANSYRIPLEK
jgi:hypothetical protein